MTRKDYIATAKLLNDAYTTIGGEHELEGFTKAVDSIARVFADDNPRFNVEKFVDACVQ